jgi:hypothetical protein
MTYVIRKGILVPKREILRPNTTFIPNRRRELPDARRRLLPIRSAVGVGTRGTFQANFSPASSPLTYTFNPGAVLASPAVLFQVVFDAGGVGGSWTHTSSATWNGINCPRIGTVSNTDDAGCDCIIDLFGMANPALGSHNFVLTWTATVAVGVGIYGISFSGVDQTTPFINFASGGSHGVTSGTVNQTITSAVGDWVYTGFVAGSAPTPTGGGTVGLNSALSFTELGIDKTGASPSVTLGFTQTADSYVRSGVDVLAAAASVVGAMVPAPIVPRGRLSPISKGPLSGLRQLKAYPQVSGTVSLSGMATIQGKGSAASQSTLAASAMAALQAKARASVIGSAAMAGRVVIQAKAAAAPLGAAALSGRATVQTKAAAASTGIMGLAGQAAIQVKALARASTGSFVALAGAATVMVKSSAASAGAAALSAGAAIQTKAAAASTGAASLAASAAVMVKAAATFTTGSFVALSGRATVMVKGAAQSAQAAALAGQLTIQVKAKAGNPVQPATAQVQYITSLGGIFGPTTQSIG